MTILHCDRATYDAMEGWNFSRLVRGRRSPAHIRNAAPLEGAAIETGLASHVATLQPELFAASHITYPKRRAGKDWEAFQEANAGKVIMSASEYETATAIAAAVRAHDIASAYLTAGAPEVALGWIDKVTGLACKCRVDWLDEQMPPLMVDLKTTRDASPHAFGAAAYRYGYHIQAAFYADGYEAITGRVPQYAIIAVESAAPYDVVCYRVSDELLARGREEYRRLLELVKDCERTGYWPGLAPNEELVLDLPPWAKESEDETGEVSLTINGQEVSL